MSFPNTKQEDFQTPGYLLEWISIQYGPIHFDMYCTDENAVAMPLAPFGLEYVRDSLIFANPPWASDFVTKAVPEAFSQLHESNTIVWLLPNKLCQVGYQTDVIPYMSKIIMLGGRVDYGGQYSAKQGSSRYGTLMCIMKRDMDWPSYGTILIQDIKRYLYETNG